MRRISAFLDTHTFAGRTSRHMYRPETAAEEQQPGMADKRDKAHEDLKKDIDR